MDQLTINNNIKYDTIKNLVLTKDFYIVFSNEGDRPNKATVNAKATLDSLFSTKDKIDLVFVAKVDKAKDVWVAAPNRTAAEKDFPAGYNFFKYPTGIEAIPEGTTAADITTLFFRKKIEANAYALFNTLSLVYCEKHEGDFLGGKYDYTDPEDEETGASQPDANPFIDSPYNFRILAQVRPASLTMNKRIDKGEDNGDDNGDDNGGYAPPKLELLIEF